MLLQVRIVRIDKNVAAVTYRDKGGMLQGRIIDSEYVAGLRAGQKTFISEKVLESGTEYGFDWSVVIDEVVLTPERFQQSLREHGIWTIEDLFTKQNEVIAAFLSLVKGVYSDLKRKVRSSVIE